MSVRARLGGRVGGRVSASACRLRSAPLLDVAHVTELRGQERRAAHPEVRVERSEHAVRKPVAPAGLLPRQQEVLVKRGRYARKDRGVLLQQSQRGVHAHVAQQVLDH